MFGIIIIVMFKDEEEELSLSSTANGQTFILGLSDDFSIEEIYEINNLAVDSIFKREKDRSKCGIRKSSVYVYRDRKFVDLLYDDDEPIFKRIFGKIGRQMEEAFPMGLRYLTSLMLKPYFHISAKLASKKEVILIIISLKYIIEDFPESIILAWIIILTRPVLRKS